MGFFSSRRSEELEHELSQDTGVVQVIRSRFYGKNKGKVRESASPSLSSTSLPYIPPQDNSVAGTPSRPTPRKNANTHHSTPRQLSSYDSAPSLRGGALKRTQPPPSPTPLPGSGSRNRLPTADVGAPPKARPTNLTISTNTTRPGQVSTDTLTVNLAQRLNELATANAQGLLDDDEYRLLRQSLFERLAGGATVPTETPLVPVSAPARDNSRTSFSAQHSRRTSSNFNATSSRSPSIHSKRSFTSAVTGLLRRSSSRHMDNKSDAGSIFSSPRTLERTTSSITRKTSHGSLKTDGGRQFESDTVSSGRYDRPSISSVFGDTHRRESSGPTKGLRKAPSAPPSSFPSASSSTQFSVSVLDALEDEERLQSAKDIRAEIEMVEAEGRRLLDAFNGLELSTLVKQHRRPGHVPLSSVAALMPSPVDTESSHGWRSTNGLTPITPLRAGTEIDVASVQSGRSGRTALSRKRSPSTGGRLGSHAAPVFQPVTLGRKSSISSMSSWVNSNQGFTSHGTLSTHSPGRFGGFGSTSSVNLSKSSSAHLPLATVSESDGSPPRKPPPLSNKSAAASSDSFAVATPLENSERGSMKSSVVGDEDLIQLEAEMADIRRRKAEVTARYEARLEYLRARLKQAELREKLLKK